MAPHVTSMTVSRAVPLCILALALGLPAAPVTAQTAEPDDAGSGRDAGEDIETAVPIEPGVEYTASLRNGDGGSATGDDDWFAFAAAEGQTINVAVGDPTLSACMTLVAPDGTALAEGCADILTDVEAPASGTYALSYAFDAVDDTMYWFGVGVDGPAPGLDLGTPSDPEVEQRPGQVVVAVADTGVNPYHEIYHRPGNTAHPCTWVEGFDDCSVPALELSIGEHDTFEEAYTADADVWASLEVHQWYWIPRTNIIGAVCEGSPDTSHVSEVCILDEHGHGTGTTSSVLTEAPDALLLVHEGNSGAYDLASAPVVPDIQSHSWGAAAPLPIHAGDRVLGLFGLHQFGDRGTFDEATILFAAAGNDVPFPTLVHFGTVHPSIQVVGAGYPGQWTTHSWTGYDFASWWCRPAATHDDLRAVTSRFCGTSAATPTAAGTAAAALLEIRRREGTSGGSTPTMVSATVSRTSFIEALRAGATYAPGTRRFHTRPNSLDAPLPLVEGREYLSWGYGWLDATRVDAVVACAKDGDCPAKSPEAEQYNAARREVRRAQTGAG